MITYATNATLGRKRWKLGRDGQDNQSIPTAILWWIRLYVVTSFFVMFEPAPTDIIFVFTLLTCISGGVISLKGRLVWPIALSVAQIFCGISSIFLAIDVGRALLYQSITIYLFVGFVLLISLKIDGDLRKELMKSYAIAAAIATVIAILGFFGVIPGEWLRASGFGRAVGAFKDPNVFGPFVIPICSYLVVQIIHRGGLIRWAFFIFLSTGCFLSFSRAAWANYIIAISLVLLICLFVKWKEVLKFVGVFVISGFVLAQILLPQSQVNTIFGSRLGLQKYDDDRFGVQREALTDARLNPMGIGPGQVEIHYDYSSHNTYIRILLENGWIALLAFLSLFSLTVFRALSEIIASTSSIEGVRDNSMITIAAFASLLGLAVNGLVVDTVHWRHLWLVLALPWIRMRSGVEL